MHWARKSVGALDNASGVKNIQREGGIELV